MTQENYGVLSDGRQVTKYTIENGILSMSVLDLGGIIQKLLVPGPDGEPVDVVLGYDTAEGCEAFRGNYFGALIGRFGNRIGEGRVHPEREGIYPLQKRRPEPPPRRQGRV